MLNFQKPTSFFKLGLLFIVALSLISCHSKSPAPPAPPAPSPPSPPPGNGTFLYHDGILLGELLQGEDESYTKNNQYLWIMSPNDYFIGVTYTVSDIYEYRYDGVIYSELDSITSSEDIVGLNKVSDSSYAILKPYIDGYPDEPRVMDVITNNGTAYYILTNYKETITLPSGSSQFFNSDHDYSTSSMTYNTKSTTTEDTSITPSTPITKDMFNKEFPQGWSTGQTGYEIKDAEGTFIRDWKA